MRKGFLIWMAVCALLVFSCKGKKDKTADGNTTDSTNVDISELPPGQPVDSAAVFHITEANKDSVLMSLTKEVLTVFKNKEYTKLDIFIHPVEGVRFSPYAYIDPANDRKVSKHDFDALVSSNKKLKWGAYDGSGDAIILTPREYFGRFVYDANFLAAGSKGVNKVLKTGNTIDNIKSAYPDADFTESHLDGSSKNAGLDWKSVRLVFRLYEGKYYLVGVVHDGWTI
ncbi:MAG: hypothetical protein QM727_03200 [Niabella sp.]